MLRKSSPLPAPGPAGRPASRVRMLGLAAACCAVVAGAAAHTLWTRAAAPASRAARAGASLQAAEVGGAAPPSAQATAGSPGPPPSLVPSPPPPSASRPAATAAASRQAPPFTPPPGGGGAGSGLNCAASPHTCGYPDATSSGVPAGTALTPSGSLVITTPGAVVSGLRVSGGVDIQASNVTIKDSDIGGSAPASYVVIVRAGVTGTLIEDSTIHGQDAGPNAAEYAIDNQGDSSTVALRVSLYYCTECYAGTGTLQDSYAIVNATVAGSHYEDSYYGGGAGTLTIRHDTLFNQQDQTAAVYISNDFGTVRGVTIANSLLAGGGYVVYGGGDTAAQVVITGNRFSRKYFSNGGSYGPDAYVSASTAWSGNIWDDTGQPVSE